MVVTDMPPEVCCESLLSGALLLPLLFAGLPLSEVAPVDAVLLAEGVRPALLLLLLLLPLLLLLLVEASRASATSSSRVLLVGTMASSMSSVLLPVLPLGASAELSPALPCRPAAWHPTHLQLSQGLLCKHVAQVAAHSLTLSLCGGGTSRGRTCQLRAIAAPDSWLQFNRVDDCMLRGLPWTQD